MQRIIEKTMRIELFRLTTVELGERSGDIVLVHLKPYFGEVIVIEWTVRKSVLPGRLGEFENSFRRSHAQGRVPAMVTRCPDRVLG